MEGWGLSPDDLVASNPRLIVLRISGYGQTGPYRNRPGFGVIGEAMGGLRHLTAEPGRVPVPCQKQLQCSDPRQGHLPDRSHHG